MNGDREMGAAAQKMAIGQLSAVEKTYFDGEAQSRLSADEELQLESPRDRELRIALEERYDQARLAREQHEEALKGVLPPEIPFEIVHDYAEKRAREILVRDELERCGWLK